jgi:hypothetical protein
MFLKKRGELEAKHIVLCVVAMILMLIPIIGSVWPIPSPPVNAFPYVFVGYLWFGFIQVMSMQHQKPKRVEEVSAEVKAQHAASGMTTGGMTATGATA